MKKRGSQSRDALTDLFSRFAGQGGTLVIPRPYIDLCKGDHLAALFLSQCLYWTDRTKDADGWFSKSFEEWNEELAMSTFQIRRVVKSLTPFGVEVKKRRSRHHGGAPTLHYRVNKEVIAQRIREFLGLVSFSLMEETHYSDQQETHYSYTETTQRLQKESAASVEARARTDHSAVESSSVKAHAEQDATETLTPRSATPPSPVATRPRTPAQQANDALVEALRQAFFTGRELPVQELGKTDFGYYLKRANELVDGGIPPSEFLAYIQYWHKASASWPVPLSLNSLTNNGRMADYKAFKSRPVSTGTPASKPYDPTHDPAYAPLLNGRGAK